MPSACGDLFARARAVKHHIFNASALLFSKIGVYIAYFAAIPVYVHAYGQASYGIVAFFGVLVGYSVLLENGLSYAVTLRYTRALARNEKAAGQKIVRAALPLYGMLALVCAAVLFFSNDTIAQLIWQKQDYAGPLRMVGLTVALLVFDAYFVSVIQSHNKLVALNMIRLAVDIVRASALYIAIFTKDPFTSVVGAFLASAVLKVILDAWYCAGPLGARYAFLPIVDWAEIRANLKLAPMTFVITAAWLVVSLFDKSYAASHVSEHDFAYYALATDLTVKAHILFYAILGTTYNVLIRRHATSQSTKIPMRANWAALLLIAAFYYLPLAAFGDKIVGHFLGAEFGAQTLPLLRILSGCSISYLAFSCLEANLNAQGRIFPVMWIYVAALLIVVSLTPFLFRLFGLPGICLSLLSMFGAMLTASVYVTLRRRG